jgi:hypothetical protein
MMTIIQEDENSNTSRKRVVESSEWIIIRELKTILSPRLYQEKFAYLDVGEFEYDW